MLTVTGIGEQHTAPTADQMQWNDMAEGIYSVRREIAKRLQQECSNSVLLPQIVKAISVVIRRAARSVRSAVRQTFAARKAAKTSDSGGDPDGRPRPQQSYTLKNPRSTPFSTAFSFGGAL